MRIWISTPTGSMIGDDFVGPPMGIGFLGLLQLLAVVVGGCLLDLRLK